MAKDIQVKKGSSPSASSSSSDFERMIDHFFGGQFGSLFADWPKPSRRYLMNVNESDEGYVLSTEIPGIPKKDIDISVNGNLLTIKAEHSEENEEEGREQGYRRQYQSFHHSFSLPSNIEAEKIEAHCEDGVLEIFLPKTQASQSKRVEVQQGKGGF